MAQDLYPREKGLDFASAGTSHPLYFEEFTEVWEANWQSTGKPNPAEATRLIH